ncbi:MAG: tRNA lysidine(34) synthetase TilS [Nitrosomonadales bacterium]|nr:tRNA lysidine(34) synthetase TilS [Nitrosomonadales bacterium]
MSHILLERVTQDLKSLLGEGRALCVGLSGGVDSVVLLHLLQQLAPRFAWRLSAVHVHHGISPNADAWADFCVELCASYAIPLQIEKVDIAPLRQHGIEAAARKLRQAAFARQPCDFIALAHHADDQAETLLLQLLRGAGIKGVAAMPALSRVEGPPLKAASKIAPATVRPLLNVSRDELLAYAAQQGLSWIEDESNADDSYPRNFLRHRVLPLLEQRFPAYRDTLARSAQHFAEASGLLDEMATQDAGDGQGETGREPLLVSRLRALPHARAKNLLRHHLQRQGAPMPQAAQLDEMLHQLCGARANATVCVNYGGWQVRRFQDQVHLLPLLRAFDAAQVLSWQGEDALAWPALHGRVIFKTGQGTGISLAKLQGAPLSLRLRCGGETLRPQPEAATRTLKNLFQENGVPPWLRERLPLLYCGEALVSVIGVAVAAEWQAQPGEAGMVVVLVLGQDGCDTG